jgi:hypothetical protein
MSTKPMKPLKRPAAKVDLGQAETMKCDECDNYLFLTSYVLKRISPLVSPTGEEGIVPIQVYSCGNCGHVPSKFLEGSGIGEETDS